MKKRFSTVILAQCITAAIMVLSSYRAEAGDGIVRVAGNGSIAQTVNCSGGHVLSDGYWLAGSDDSFIQKGSREFSFLADGELYSGESDWKKIKVSTGESTTVSMKSEDGRLAVEIIYTSYPGLALVRKEICITNTGDKDVRIEGMNVEDVKLGRPSGRASMKSSFLNLQTLLPNAE